MEETKCCRTCGINQPMSLYGKYSNRNSLKPDCNPCIAKKQREYLTNNPKVKERRAEVEKQKYWEKRNKELPELIHKLQTIRICGTCGYQGTIDHFKKPRGKQETIDKKRLKGTCKPCEKKRTKRWIENNPDKMKQYHKQTYARRKQDDDFIQKKKEYDRWKLQTDQEFRERRKQQQRENRKTSPIAIWRRLLSNTLNQLHTSKTDKTQKMLGYSASELFQHLGEKQNTSDHIDHHIPLSWFKEKTNANLACNLQNLGWLTEKENLQKNNRYANPVEVDYFNKVKIYIKEEFIDRFSQQDNMMVDTKKDIILERWANKLSSVF